MATKRVATLVGHGLQVAGNAAVGLGELDLTEPGGDCLFHFAHLQIALGAIRS